MRRKMMYYRVAIQPKGSVRWQWKSTALSSLDTVIRFLRLYQALPPDRLRVFSSLLREELDSQLANENNGLGSHSVTAAQFLRKRLIYVQKVMPEMPGLQPCEQHQVALIGAATDSLHERILGAHALDERSTSLLLERRRIEVEYGTASDHDLPYSFALPTSWPQILAWVRLLAKVHTGVLSP
jgi:hypothetical protein